MEEWLQCWEGIELSRLYGFPLWEGEVHAIVQKQYRALKSIFNVYSASLLDKSSGTANTMNIDELPP